MAGANYYELSFRSPRHARGGPVTTGSLRKGALHGPQALALLRREPSLVFLVHGFNVNLADGTDQLPEMAKVMALGAAAVVGVLWPGDHVVGAASYPFEGVDADDTARRLAAWVDDHLDARTRLAFVSHSLGARVVFGTIDALPARFADVHSVCPLAAAVDDDTLTARGRWPALGGRVARIRTLNSDRDRVLRYAYRVGDMVQAVVFDEHWGRAMGLDGAQPESRQPATVSNTPIPSRLKARHGHYVPKPDTPKYAGVTDWERAKQHAAARFAAAVVSGGDATYDAPDVP